MNVASISVLPLVSCALAFLSWAIAQSRPRPWLAKAALATQACFALYLGYLLVLVLIVGDSLSIESGVQDAAGVWLNVGGLFVESAFELRAPQFLGAVLVLLGTSASLWWSRTESARVSSLLGLQGSLWLCLLGTDLPVAAAGFIIAGYLLPRVQASAVSLPTAVGVPGLHRTADGFAMSAILVWLIWSPLLAIRSTLKLQLDTDDSVMLPIAGMSASAWMSLLLSLALVARVAGAFAPRPRTRVSVVMGAMVALQSCHWASTMVPGRFAVALVSSSVLGLALSYFLGTFFATTRLLPAIHKGFRGCGWVVSGMARWVFSGVLLQAPVVVVDVCARAIKLVAGGDIQRYVAIGIIGLAALVFVATRPATPAALTIQTDGLRIRANAQRGALSSARLLYDYDFDGDEQIDRASVGPSAGFTYAAAGTYSISVTVHDPFWHTQKTLRAKVQVKP